MSKDLIENKTNIEVISKEENIELIENIIRTPNIQNPFIVKNTECPFSVRQIVRILERTPKEKILQRPGKGGRPFKYVSGGYIKDKLNCAFAWLWDSEVVHSENIIVDGKIIQIVVDIKLTINRINPKTQELQKIIEKTQTGRHDVAYLKGTNIPVDFGNDRKSAITDGLKKCASELGIASDVYSENDYNDNVVSMANDLINDIDNTPTKEEFENFKKQIKELGIDEEKLLLALGKEKLEDFTIDEIKRVIKQKKAKIEKEKILNSSKNEEKNNLDENLDNNKISKPKQEAPKIIQGETETIDNSKEITDNIVDIKADEPEQESVFDIIKNDKLFNEN